MEIFHLTNNPLWNVSDSNGYFLTHEEIIEVLKGKVLRDCIPFNLNTFMKETDIS
jgi:hypothetical protein